METSGPHQQAAQTLRNPGRCCWKRLGLGDDLKDYSKKLMRAGFHNQQSLLMASDDELLGVKGIGPKALAKIKKALWK